MKTQNVFIALSLITISAIVSCKPDVKNGNTVVADTTGIVDTTHFNNTAQSFQVPISDIKLMVSNYKTERQEIINNNEGLRKLYGRSVVDTRSIWFSIDQLKQFIKELEDTEKNGKTNSKLDGLRVYLTVYPKKTEGESEYLKSIPDEYRNHLSMIFVPTYIDSLSKSKVEFDSDWFGNPTGGQSIQALSAKVGAETTSAYNHGALCPPNCPIPSSGN